MIDDLETVEKLMQRLQAALPMAARVGRDVLRELRREAPDAPASPRCQVSEVRYMGDEGGILCRLEFADNGPKNAHYVSITHVTFERRNPLRRDIEAYKRHRIKRLR